MKPLTLVTRAFTGYTDDFYKRIKTYHTAESKSPISFQRASKHWRQLIEKPDSQLRVAGSADDTDHTALKHYKNNPYSWGTKRGFPTTRPYPLLVELHRLISGPARRRQGAVSARLRHTSPDRGLKARICTSSYNAKYLH